MAINTTPSERALQIHRDAIVFDGHCDTLLDMMPKKRRWDLFEGQGHIDMPRLQQGGITAQIMACYVREHARPAAAGETLRLIETMYEIVEGWPAQVTLATKAADVRQAKRDGKIAAILGMEGAEGVAGDITLLRAFHRLGVRNIGLTWNYRNEVADGHYERRSGGGLTEFGVRFVQEMRRLGILVDIAHLAPRGVADVFEVYDGPVVASHANAQALCGHWRNLTDAQLEQVARSGGVVGVTFVPAFICDDENQATLGRLLDHVDHIVKVIGIDHVGLGSDWDGFGGPTSDFPCDVSETPFITEGLIDRGYKDEEIRKFLGENWMRAFSEVAG